MLGPLTVTRSGESLPLGGRQQKAVLARLPRFEVYSPQMKVVMPLDNFLDLPPGPATFVVNGWLALIRHAAPGLHAIRIERTFLNSSEPDVTNRSIEVVRSR